ncbi:MAG: hypothetical protein PHE02_13235 [Lachnospiraceae bacterium]|nr:hypothetical protein [Lachnospiraceae bacterium]
MNLTGMRVTHEKYGQGKVVGITGNKMNIDFKTGEKLFLYPDAFQDHLVLKDKKAEQYVMDQLKEQNEMEREAKEQQRKKAYAAIHAKRARSRANSQAVFDLSAQEIEEIPNHWSVFCGNSLSGKAKGMPRIYKEINMNSACILTNREKSEKEHERSIVGIFMPVEDYIGENCVTGIIPAHEKYRLLWTEGHEKLLFWEYLPEHLRMEKWGNAKVKYVTAAVVKKILEDMTSVSEETDREFLQDFQEYFSHLN